MKLSRKLDVSRDLSLRAINLLEVAPSVGLRVVPGECKEYAIGALFYVHRENFGPGMDHVFMNLAGTNKKVDCGKCLTQ